MLVFLLRTGETRELPVLIIKIYAVVLNRALKTASQKFSSNERKDVNICKCYKCFLYIKKFSTIITDIIIYVYFVLD